MTHAIDSEIFGRQYQTNAFEFAVFVIASKEQEAENMLVDTNSAAMQHANVVHQPKQCNATVEGWISNQPRV